jgi:hypothetical protein
MSTQFRTSPLRHVLPKQDEAQSGMHLPFATTYSDLGLWCNLSATPDLVSIQAACQLDALLAEA